MDERQGHNGRHAADTAREFAEEARAGFEEGMGKARDLLEGFDTQMRRWVRERPGACLVAAVAAGWLIGRLASRR